MKLIVLVVNLMESESWSDEEMKKLIHFQWLNPLIQFINGLTFIHGDQSWIQLNE